MKSITQELQDKHNLKILLGLVIISTLARIIPHSPNFTPIGGLCVFLSLSFLQISKRLSIAVILSSMFISDIFLGFHSQMVGVYIALTASLLIAGTSHLFIENIIGKICLSSLTTSVVFFVLSNFFVWLEGRIYPQTLDGLVTCFEMALPFFRAFLNSTLIYSSVLTFLFYIAIVSRDAFQKTTST